MKLKDLIDLYEMKKKKYGINAYKHISELLREAKEVHYRDWMKSPTRKNDHEQSWRAFKGKNLEGLIIHVIKDEVASLNLGLVSGNKLEKTHSQNLPKELSEVKRRLLIDYGEFGFHLPDIDIVIYDPRTYRILAVISSKVTLRERIAQTAYWKSKLAKDEATKHIKVFFITPDEDGTLTYRKPAKKGRAIVELGLDGSYAMSETRIEESERVKMFDQFISDLKGLLSGL